MRAVLNSLLSYLLTGVLGLFLSFNSCGALLVLWVITIFKEAKLNFGWRAENCFRFKLHSDFFPAPVSTWGSRAENRKIRVKMVFERGSRAKKNLEKRRKVKASSRVWDIWSVKRIRRSEPVVSYFRESEIDSKNELFKSRPLNHAQWRINCLVLLFSAWSMRGFAYQPNVPLCLFSHLNHRSF